MLIDFSVLGQAVRESFDLMFGSLELVLIMVFLFLLLFVVFVKLLKLKPKLILILIFSTLIFLFLLLVVVSYFVDLKEKECDLIVGDLSALLNVSCNCVNGTNTLSSLEESLCLQGCAINSMNDEKYNEYMIKYNACLKG